jgi:hypothetical protein
MRGSTEICILIADGRPDLLQQDADGDGRLDAYALDLDGDGEIDRVGRI